MAITIRFGDITGIEIDYAGTQDTDLNSTYVNYNYGTTTLLYAGSVISNNTRRILIAFDLESLNEDRPLATITGVRFIGYCTAQIGTDSTLYIYPVLKTYGVTGQFVSGYGDVSEGTKNGATAGQNEPTYNKAQYNTVNDWGSPGCKDNNQSFDGTSPTLHYNTGDDIGSTILGQIDISVSGTFTITLNATGISVVQTQIRNAGCRLGFALVWGIEGSSSNYVQIASSENPTTTHRPYLEIDLSSSSSSSSRSSSSSSTSSSSSSQSSSSSSSSSQSRSSSSSSRSSSSSSSSSQSSSSSSSSQSSSSSSYSLRPYLGPIVKFGDRPGTDYSGTQDAVMQIFLNTLFGDLNDGARDFINVGSMSSFDYRSLIAFDLKAYNDDAPGIEITSVILTLCIWSKYCLIGPCPDRSIDVYAALKPWGSSLATDPPWKVFEGAKYGSAATSGEPTWNSYEHGIHLWNAAGASATTLGVDGDVIEDYDGIYDRGYTSLGSVIISGGIAYGQPIPPYPNIGDVEIVFNDLGKQVVKFQKENPNKSYGFVLLYSTESSINICSICSSEHATEIFRPQLEISRGGGGWGGGDRTQIISFW
jgi:hypothetical protein